jgi:hypothetical protein
MAKYLRIGTTGLPTEEATVLNSAGAGSAGLIPELDSTGRLTNSVMPVGIGADVKTANAGEGLSAGNLVYISAAGTVFKADANAVDKAAIGFVLASSASGASATVYFEGTITGLTGLTAGTRYFLSDTATGGVTATLPTGVGDIVQLVGTAISATELSFEPQTPLVRA